MQEWRKSREAEIEQQRAVQLHYDWTYTSPYTGTVTATAAASTCSGSCASSMPPPVQVAAATAAADTAVDSSAACSPLVATAQLPQQEEAAGPATPRSFSERFACSQTFSRHAAAAVTADVVGSSGNASEELKECGAEGCSCRVAETAKWESTSEHIDRSVLMEREPILFFDEVTAHACVWCYHTACRAKHPGTKQKKRKKHPGTEVD